MAFNAITKGMSNAAEMINDNFTKTQEATDTGWVPVTLTNVDAGDISYRYKNGVVYLHGFFRKTGEVRGSEILIGTLPQGYRPDVFRRVEGVATPAATNLPEDHSAIVNIQIDGRIMISKKSGAIEFYIETAYPV